MQAFLLQHSLHIFATLPLIKGVIANAFDDDVEVGRESIDARDP